VVAGAERTASDWDWDLLKWLAQAILECAGACFSAK
jgi:hypothetical protein